VEVREEEIEVKDFVIEGRCDEEKLAEYMFTEMVEYVKDNIIPPYREDQNDKVWWMSSTEGDFTIKSAWQIVRIKNEIGTDFDFI